MDSYVLRALELFEAYGDAEAIVAYDRRLTYAELRSGVLSMAATLHGHGIRPGMGVAVLAGSPPEAVVLQFALHLIGARAAWIAPNAPGKYRTDYVRLAEVDAFVYDPANPELGALLAASSPDLPVYCLGPGGLGPDLTAGAFGTELTFDPAEITEEPQSLFQTGGTTGQPKLVHHRHKFFQTVMALAGYYLAGGEHQLRHLSISGMWHVSSQVPAMMTLFTGGTFVMQDGLEFEDFFAAVEAEKITDTLLPPPILYLMLDHPSLGKYDLSSFRRVSIGGSAIAPSRLAEAIDRFGPVFRPVYGMSEAAFITANPGVTTANPELLKSCGAPYGDMRIEIRDEDGAAAPTGGIGEVCLTGGLMMVGYWGQPELTAETLVDGWLRTGDMGYVDENGLLYLVDRLKDMIPTGYGGTNIFSRPVEDTLTTHPDVRSAAVIGVPDSRYGEAAHAYVVITPGSTVTNDELRALVTAELNEAWTPREIEFIEALPLTAVGKVDKKALREMYLAELDDPS